MTKDIVKKEESQFESEESILEKTDGNSIPFHTMDGYNTIGKVTEVYDGDTITVIMKYKNCMDKFKIRLIGYDSPELKPRKDIDDRQNIVSLAKEAKKQLSDKVLNKIVKVHCHDFEKYGRLLATIYTMDNEDVNEWMIKNGSGCKEYDGGKKLKI